MTVETKGNDEVFVSTLGVGREAFLAEVAERSLALGERSARNFIRHFSCTEIMESLAERPEERAKILVDAASMNPRIASRISPEAAGETLQIALDEGVTNPQQIVELFTADDRQRYLKNTKLWTFAVSGDPGRKTRKGTEFERGKKLIGYILERALHHKLIEPKQLIAGLTVSRLTSLLPASLLATVIEASLDATSKFSHADMVKLVPPERLVAHVPLDYIWEKVVVPLIAEAHGYLEAEAPSDKKSNPSDKKSDPSDKKSDPGNKLEPAAKPTTKSEIQSDSSAAKAPEPGKPSGERSDRVSDVVELKNSDSAAKSSPSSSAGDANAKEKETQAVVEAAAAAAEAFDEDEDDVMLDDDDEEVQMVSDEEDVFDDLLEEGLMEPEPTSGANFKGEAPKKNANAH